MTTRCPCGRPKSAKAAQCMTCEKLDRDVTGRMTEAELDAFIAERYANRPAWWDREYECKELFRGEST